MVGERDHRGVDKREETKVNIWNADYKTNGYSAIIFNHQHNLIILSTFVPYY